MKKRLRNILFALFPLIFFMVGRPWLLYSQESPGFVAQRWATDTDLTLGPKSSPTMTASSAPKADPTTAPAAIPAVAPLAVQKTIGVPRQDADIPLPPPPAADLTAPSPAAHHRTKAADSEKWTFTSDRVVAQHDSQYIEAEGNAIFRKGPNVLRADFARYYQATGWIVLRGHVDVLWNGDFLQAEEAEFDLRTAQGWLKNGKIFVAAPHLYFKSDYIRKYAGQSYHFKNAKITACAGKSPDWSFSAEEGDITLDGFAKLWHTTFNIRDVPVVWLPYAQLSASNKRKSGFLKNEFSISSRFGLRVNLPYYWVINDEMDITAYQHFMSKRGYMQGLELRVATDSDTKGLFHFDWLNDSKTYRTRGDEDGDELVDKDDLLRPNSNRWWVRSKYNGYLGTPSWRVMADVDAVSDQDYLREFKDGYSGYETSRDQFYKEFGRDLAPADDLKRTSTALLTRDFDDYSVTGRIEYTQNLQYANGNGKNSDNPTVQRWPEIDVFKFKDSIPGTPLEVQASAKYDYFYREAGTTGHRLKLNPKLSLPLASDWGTIIPSVGYNQLTYLGTKHGTAGQQVLDNGVVVNDPTDDSSFQNRFWFDTDVTAFSELFRVYRMQAGETLNATEQNVGESRWTAVKHSFIPRLEYQFSPTLHSQDKYPAYDKLDRPQGTNRITYSLTNVFDRKTRTVSLSGQGSDAVPRLSENYLDFLRLRLEQSYDANEATRQVELGRYRRRPFSDIMAEIILQPTEGLSLTSKTYYSPYLGAVTEHKNMLRYEREDLGSAFLSYDYQDRIDEYTRQYDDPMGILRLGGDVYIAHNLLLGLEFRHDLWSGDSLEKTIRLTWLRDCWNLNLKCSVGSTDTSFGLSFDLIQF